MPPYSGFKPLVGGGPQRAPPAAKPAASRSGLHAQAVAPGHEVDDVAQRRSTEPALRSTFVDKEEAAMLRAMARLNGEDPGRKAGESFSNTNRAKLKVRQEQAAALGLVPLDPKEQHDLHRKMEAGYTSISERAVRVPKVGRRAPGPRPAPIEYVPHRKAEDVIRWENDDFEREQAPMGRPTESSDEKKDELALRNQFYGKTPQEIIAESPGPRLAPQKASSTSLKGQIEDEVAERQQFLDNMRALGRGAEHEKVIAAEIQERLQDLKALERLEAT